MVLFLVCCRIEFDIWSIRRTGVLGAMNFDFEIALLTVMRQKNEKINHTVQSSFPKRCRVYDKLSFQIEWESFFTKEAQFPTRIMLLKWKNKAEKKSLSSNRHGPQLDSSKPCSLIQSMRVLNKLRGACLSTYRSFFNYITGSLQLQHLGALVNTSLSQLVYRKVPLTSSWDICDLWVGAHKRSALRVDNLPMGE